MKKIIVSICVIGLMLMSSRASVNAFDKGELSRELEAEGNTLITEFGNNQTIEVDSAGNIVWQKTGLNLPQDAERLSNGNTLITEYGGGRVIEVDTVGNIVWQKTGLNEPVDAERLSNGNTLITEFGGGRVIEVDTVGNIVWQKTGLTSPFDAERLSNGNTLIVESWPVGRVIEVDSAGNIIWNKTGLVGPVDAERLSNGNTLITEHIGKRVIEVNTVGNIVWQKTGLGHPKDAERLSNGTTLITECSANRVIEVDTVGNIVWQKTGLYYPTDAERLPNQPPNAPMITGSTSGKAGVEYDYTFIATDPEGYVLYYWIDWGDGSVEEWIGPYESGVGVIHSHTWSQKGTYNISAKVKDICDAESPWGILEVTMPKNQQSNSRQTSSQSSQTFQVVKTTAGTTNRQLRLTKILSFFYTFFLSFNPLFKEKTGGQW